MMSKLHINSHLPGHTADKNRQDLVKPSLHFDSRDESECEWLFVCACGHVMDWRQSRLDFGSRQGPETD